MTIKSKYPLTLARAKNLSHGTVLHYGNCAVHIGPRGGKTFSIENWRVNGRPKTWVKQPTKVKVPIKYGLRAYSYITEFDLEFFHLANECEVLNGEYGVNHDK